MIMSGAKDATIRQVQLIDIHGTRFYDIAFSHDEAPESVHSARIGTESAYEQPRPGDLVRVSYLMNVVTGITRRTA